ncbi:MAG: flippase [Candidatus Eisenbacteria bacterium]
MNESRKYVRDIAVTGAGTAAVRLRQLILLPVLARMLGAADYGAWTQLVAAVGLLAAISGALGNASTRFVADKREGTSEAGRVVSGTAVPALLLSLVLAAVLFGFSDRLAESVLKLPSFSSLVRLAALAAVGTTGSGVAKALFRGRSRFGIYNLLTILSEYGELLLVVLAVALGHGLPGAVVAMLAARSASAVVSLLVASGKIGVARPRLEEVRAFLAYSLPLMPQQVLLWVIHLSDRYIIGYHWGSTSVGEYSAAYSISAVVTLVAAPILVVVFPMLSRLWDSGDKEGAGRYTERTFKYLLLMAVPLALGLSAVSREVLRLVAGDAFAAAGAFVPFVVVGLLFHRLQGLYSYVLMAAKRTRAVMWVHTLTAVFNIGANLVLIPRVGPMAAAYVTLATYVLGAALVWGLARGSLASRLAPGLLVKVVAISCGLALGVRAFSPSGWIELVVTGAAAAAAYAGLIVVLRVVTVDELRALVSMMRPGRGDEA